MKPHLKYLVYVLKHKWFVLVAGLKTGAPLWRLIIHDYSKFSRAEWTPYVNKFFRPALPEDEDEYTGLRRWARKVAFKAAWKHHYERNPHHWNYWLSTITNPNGQNLTRAHAMPDHFVREMVADWMGAGRAITGKWEVKAWYEKTKDTMQLHPDTRVRVEQLLRDTVIPRDS